MEALEIARRKAIMDREKLFNILLDLRGNDTKFLNDKLNALSTEIETIGGQLEQYRGLKDSKVMIYDEMRRMIDAVASLSNLLSTHPDNFDIQRQLLIANINQIRCEEKNVFKIEYRWSSRLRQEWQPRQDSNLD